MIDAVKPYLDLAAGITQATVAKAVESAQGIIARNAPGSDLLDQAQIGSLGLVSVNLGTDQHFQDDSGPEATEPTTDEAPEASTKVAKAKAKGKKKSKKKGKQAAADDTSGSDVLDQAQIGSMGLLSINLGGRQRLVDDEGGEVAITAATIEAEIAALRADVAALAEALVAIGAVELEHMETVPRRHARKARARRRSTRKAPAAKVPARKPSGRRVPARKASGPSSPSAAPAKKAPAKKAPAKKAPAKKAPARKAPAKKAPAKKAPAKKAPAKKAPARKAPVKKAPARRRAAADD